MTQVKIRLHIDHTPLNNQVCLGGSFLHSERTDECHNTGTHPVEHELRSMIWLKNKCLTLSYSQVNLIYLVYRVNW